MQPLPSVQPPGPGWEEGWGRCNGMVSLNGLGVGGHVPCPHADTTVNLELLN